MHNTGNEIETTGRAVVSNILHEVEKLGVKSEMLLQEMEFLSDVDILKSPQAESHVEEDLAAVKLPREKEKLERTKRKTGFPAFGTNLEKKIELLEPSTRKGKLRPGQQMSTHMEARNVTVIGGRDQNGDILRSVEAHLFFEGRWIELPAMNTPPSFMSSVVVDQCVIISDGQTGVHDITDTITLTVTLIGEHDGNEGKNSDTIYEISFTPAHTHPIMSSLTQAKA